ncbi:MAG: SUMF1/EgtB/PvdO family nonheme iron enzyme [Vicinamibacterales bacterium]
MRHGEAARCRASISGRRCVWPRFPKWDSVEWTCLVPVRICPRTAPAILAWTAENSGRRAHQVGTRAADTLGLHDLIGNASEWGLDWTASEQDQTRSGEPVTRILAVAFGSNYSDTRERAGCADYAFSDPGDGYDRGFRVVRLRE